ncbi:MAG: hypothetical protein ACRDPR_20515 [Nocardioidaceae bacterium]
MQTLTVTPTDIRVGDILCGDDGVPFAKAATVKTRRARGRVSVRVTTTGLDGTGEGMPVSFPAGSNAIVQR